MLKKIFLILLLIPLAFAQTDIYQVGDAVNYSFSLQPVLPSQENSELGTYTRNDASVILFHNLRHEVLFNEKISGDTFNYNFNKKIYESGNYYIQATVVSAHSKFQYGKWSNYTFQNNTESYYFTVEGKPSIMDSIKSYFSSLSEKIAESTIGEFINSLILKIKAKVGSIKL